MAGASQWAVPLLLGLVAALGAYGLDQLPDAPVQTQPQPFASSTAPSSGLVFGEDGVATARLTVYAFKESGRLLASNAPANATASFPLDGDYQQLPELTLHLANSTPPTGSFRLPAQFRVFERPIAENLTGHRVGEVVEVHLTHYPWLDIFGPLRVVARIDALLPPIPPVEAAHPI